MVTLNIRDHNKMEAEQNIDDKNWNEVFCQWFPFIVWVDICE